MVTPPAAAARVAVAKPSHSVRPGSLTCTWVSTSPGSSTSVVRASPSLGRRPAVVRLDRRRSGRPHDRDRVAGRSPVRRHDPPRPQHQVSRSRSPAVEHRQGGPVDGPTSLGVERAAVQRRAAGSRPAPARWPARRATPPPRRRRYAAQPVAGRGQRRRGRTRRWPRTGSAAAPGAGPSPGRSRARSERRTSRACSRQAACTCVGSPTGSTLVEPSDSAHAGAGGGDLHHRLGVVGGRVVQRLLRGGDAERRAVVVGAVVQADAAAVGGVHQPGHGGRAVRRRAPPAASRPAARSAAARRAARAPSSSAAQQPTIASTCSTDGHLGQGDHEAVRRRPRSSARRGRGPACARRGAGWPPPGT